jgi:hypothetical protein
MRRVRACQGKLKGRRKAFLADQRGAVSFEFPFVFILLIFSFMFPLADVAIAGFRYISALQALRAFGHSIQYSPPTDFSNTSGWAATAVAKADPNYPISNLQVFCDDGNVGCTAANAGNSPLKYYSYSTTVTLSPMVLNSVLCTSGAGNGCTFTLPYSERFQ